MGPHLPLNFFMTRLLFVEQNKVDSLKAKSDKAKIEIVVDNPRILRETEARSLPPPPAPPAAPESPRAVEGWKGAKVGGWILGSGNKGEGVIHLPPLYTNNTDDTAAEHDRLARLCVNDDDDDHTDITEESSLAASDTAALHSERLPQLFPANSARGMPKRAGSFNGRHKSKSCSIKKSGSLGARSGLVVKKTTALASNIKSSLGVKKGSGSRSSSPSNSGGED